MSVSGPARTATKVSYFSVCKNMIEAGGVWREEEDASRGITSTYLFALN